MVCIKAEWQAKQYIPSRFQLFSIGQAFISEWIESRDLEICWSEALEVWTEQRRDFRVRGVRRSVIPIKQLHGTFREQGSIPQILQAIKLELRWIAVNVADGRDAQNLPLEMDSLISSSVSQNSRLFDVSA